LSKWEAWFADLQCAPWLKTDGAALWKDRLDGLTRASLDFFFPKGVAEERPCELAHKSICEGDMLGLKGQLHSSLAAAVQVAPYLAGLIQPKLLSSATAAVAQCTGEDEGLLCGFYWSTGEYVKPKVRGALEQLNVLAAVQSLLAVDGRTGLGSDQTGGDGDGDDGTPTSQDPPKETSGADRTKMGLMGVVGGLVLARLVAL